MSLVDNCTCGHDRLTQHFDGTHACLAVLCDCHAFDDPKRPRPKSRPVRPSHHVDCKCFTCKWARGEIDEKGRPTP